MPLPRLLFPAACGLAVLLASASGQELPVVSQALPDVVLNGTETRAFDLKQHFAVPGIAAPLAQIQTVLGTFNIQLLQADAPLSVQNFLNYTNRGAYNNTFIHRLARGFVIQGGGWQTAVPNPVKVPQDPPVTNEFKVSNTRGTLAMAKLGTDPNSATSEWFVNLADNSANLNTQNGGFTVFARVIGTGMTVVDAIAALPIVVAASPFDTLPVRDFVNGSQLVVANLINLPRVSQVPVFPVNQGDPAIVQFSGALDVDGRVDAKLAGSTLTLTPLPGIDGITNVTIHGTDANGNRATSTFRVTATHLVTAGAGSQVNFNTVHPNGNTFDQILLTGPTVTFGADAGQVTRASFIDLNDDIVQLEFSGAGTVQVTLEGVTGPAAPLKYSQAVNYMKGHAVIAITGANETSNLSVTSVGRLTAFDPTGAWDLARPASDTNNPLNNGNPIFRATETYDGIADVALVTIASTNGKFGGVRMAGAALSRSAGRTGLDAAGIEFTGRVLLHDLMATGTATPVLLTGAVGTAEADPNFRGKLNVAGSNLAQPNGQPVQVGGLEKVRFIANRNSHHVLLPAQNNAATFTRAGADVTAAVVENPTP